MTQNSHWGSTLESFLEEEGILEEANAYATKKILAWQIAKAIKEQGSSKPDVTKKINANHSSETNSLNQAVKAQKNGQDA